MHMHILLDQPTIISFPLILSQCWHPNGPGGAQLSPLDAICAPQPAGVGRTWILAHAAGIDIQIDIYWGAPL